MGVEEAIAAHRAAIQIDEANFDDAGVPFDRAAADASGKVEVSAYAALIHVPCSSAADVQAKLDYMLHGSVGMRSTLVACLLAEEYGATYGAADRNGENDGSNVVRDLLRSLMVTP